MFKTDTEYELFKESLKSFEDIELTKKEKVMLENIDKDTIKAIHNRAYNKLVSKMLSEELPRDYVLWYKHWLAHFVSYFRTYK